MAASQKVAKAIREAPWKKKKKEEKELARTRVGTRQVQGPKWARARSLGRRWLGRCKHRPRGCLRTRSSRRTGWVLWWFAQRQRLRRQLRQELPRGSVGAKLADLLDSDCESCSGRRRTSHATAAERAADYVKRVRERVVARRLREQAAAKEDRGDRLRGGRPRRGPRATGQAWA